MTQHVLITGGSQGAGKATALKFARAGWDVTIAARKRDRLQAVAEQIEATGQKALAVPTDIGIEEQVKALVEQDLLLEAPQLAVEWESLRLLPR